MENIQALNNLEIFLANSNTKSCEEKIDNIVKTNDMVLIIGYRTLSKSLIIKLGKSDDLNDCYIIASYFFKEIVFNTIKNENQFSLITGPSFKTNPQNERTQNYLAP